MTFNAYYTQCNGETETICIGKFYTRHDAATACATHFHREHAETRNTQDRDVFAAYHFDRGQLAKWCDLDPLTVIGTNGRFHQYAITMQGEPA